MLFFVVGLSQISTSIAPPSLPLIMLHLFCCQLCYDIMFIFSSCCQSTSPRVRQTDPFGFKMSSWRTFTPTDIPMTHTGSNEKLEHPAKRNTKHNGHTKTELLVLQTGKRKIIPQTTGHSSLVGSGVSVCAGLFQREPQEKKN